MGIGERIKAARKSAGLTQKALAEKIGAATGTIQQYELGKRQPRIERLQAIAAALNVDPYSLYSFDQASDTISDEINEGIQYKTQITEIMEKVTVEGLRIGKEIFEAIAGNPKYQMCFDHVPFGDELEQPASDMSADE